MHSAHSVVLPSFKEAFGGVIEAAEASPPPIRSSYSHASLPHFQPYHLNPNDTCSAPSPSSSSSPGRERRKRSRSIESSASSERSAPSPPARSHDNRSQGFIILRPTGDDGELRVAAASRDSFTDALDALRHRTAPQSTGVDESDCFGKDATPRQLYPCPVKGCHKKYTFSSNLRRHIRKTHSSEPLKA